MRVIARVGNESGGTACLRVPSGWLGDHGLEPGTEVEAHIRPVDDAFEAYRSDC